MPHEKLHLIGHITYIALYCLLILFSALFYNSANLVTLLHTGWITLIFGITILLNSSQSRKKGRVSENEDQEILVESGMYALVRHPEFLGHLLIISSLVLIAQHIFSLIIEAILIFLLYFAMIEEEKQNIEKFGEAYRDYMQRVPRINLFAGIVRQIHIKMKSKKRKE